MIINKLSIKLFNPYSYQSYNTTRITIRNRSVFSQMNAYNLINKRYFSSGKPSTLIVYANADTQKLSILMDNKGKAGIYLWRNNLNGNKYVGSSIRLGIRLTQYFNINYLKRNLSSMAICQPLLKYGYSNFSLEILEYCDSSECIKKETHYIDKLKPEYNIQLFPSTPMLGVKRRADTIAKLKKSLTGLSKSDQHKLNLSLADPGSTQIEAIDLVENKTTVHHSMRGAAR